MQDLSVRMSASGSCRTSCARTLYVDLLSKISLAGYLHQDPVGSCARSLYVDLLSKISLAGYLHQDPVGPLVQDLCMKISGARCLRPPQRCPVGALVQDRCMRISCVRCLCQDLLGSCRSTCARSACADLLCKISLL